MRGRPAIGLAIVALVVVVAFGVIADGTGAPELATQVPTSIPVGGVNINGQWVLMPVAPGDVPTLDRSQAITAAGSNKESTLVPPTAILARVTVPGTIPPPDSPVPFRAIEDRLAWVVTFTFDRPVVVGSEKAPSGAGQQPDAPPLMATHFSAVLDADSGDLLIGFLT